MVLLRTGSKVTYTANTAVLLFKIVRNGMLRITIKRFDVISGENELSIDPYSWTKGVYMMGIKTLSGGEVIFKRIVKQ